MRRWLFLPYLKHHDDLAYLALRVLTGAFLIYGVWDNITSIAAMREFTGFLRGHKFPLPEIAAPLAIYGQFLAGLGLIVGLFTRWAGLVLVVTFVVAILMVHWDQSFRDWWPAAVLVGLGALFASRGGARFSIDRVLGDT